jgi:hypothetical protein
MLIGLNSYTNQNYKHKGDSWYLFYNFIDIKLTLWDYPIHYYSESMLSWFFKHWCGDGLCHGWCKPSDHI